MKNKSIHHWLVVVACSGLAMGSIGISINCAGIFFAPVSESLGVGRGDISITVTLTNLVTGLCGPFIATRLIGRVNMKLLTGVCAALSALCYAALSVANHIAVFYVVCALVGLLITGYGMIVISHILGNWFEQRHGFAMGLTLSCSGLGGAVFNPLLSAVIESVGWRSAYLVTAGIILVLTLPGIILIIREHPSARGLLPYGAATPDSTSPAQAHAPQRVKFTTAAFLLSTTFAVLAYAVTGFNAHIPGLATSLGFSVSTGALMVSAAMIGNVSFKLLIGVLSDRFGAPPANAVMLIASALGMSIIAFVPGVGAVVPLIGAFLFGGIFAVGAVGIPLIVRYVFGPRLHSVAYSYTSFFACISSSATMAGFGYSYDLLGTYMAASVFCIVTALLTAAILIPIRRQRGKGETA